MVLEPTTVLQEPRDAKVTGGAGSLGIGPLLLRLCHPPSKLGVGGVVVMEEPKKRRVPHTVSPGIGFSELFLIDMAKPLIGAGGSNIGPLLLKDSKSGL